VIRPAMVSSKRSVLRGAVLGVKFDKKFLEEAAVLGVEVCDTEAAFILRHADHVPRSFAGSTRAGLIASP